MKKNGLKKEVIEKAKRIQPLRIELMKHFGCSEVTLRRYFKNNDLALTQIDALEIISNGLKTPLSEILSEKSNIPELQKQFQDG